MSRGVKMDKDSINYARNNYDSRCLSSPFSAKLDPAYTITRYLGGANHVANILGINICTVYCFARGYDQNGCNGRIPYKHMIRLLAYADYHDIDLRFEDFGNCDRLRFIMRNIPVDAGNQCCICGYECGCSVSYRKAPWMFYSRRINNADIIDKA